MTTLFTKFKDHSPQTLTNPGESIKAQLIGFTNASKLDSIVDLLYQNPETDIVSISNAQSYSLLHLACFNNRTNICKYFFQFLKYQKVPAEKIESWVKAKTDEGFTALHFASFKGNIELIKLLEQHGADIHTKNNQGLSVIHIAAQGDQPVSIAYFQFKGLNIEEVDEKGSSALHWATFLGMENAVTYLLTWGASPNIQDKEFALTPLHLGALSGNPRIVRKLLSKGANKAIRSKEGKLPIDIAIENEYDDIIEILDKNWLLTLFNIKSSYPKRNSRLPLYFLILLFTIVVGTNICFIFPYIEDAVWAISFIILASMTLFFLFCSWLSDPGYLKNPKKSDILNLLLNNDPQKICPECVIIKPERSKHCEYCKACISVYDHHCPWIYNCVGSRNHGYFLAYIITTLLAIFFIFALGLTYFEFNFDPNDQEPTYKYFPKLVSNEHVLYYLKQATCFENFVLFIFFGIPLIILNYIQIGNFFMGKTTHERYGFHTIRENINNTLIQSSLNRKDKYLMNENGENQHRKWYTNCYFMCLKNKKIDKYSYQRIQSPSLQNHFLSSDCSP